MLSDISGKRKRALRAAQEFLNLSDPLDELGYGVSGFVFADDTGQGAVKVHHTAEGYITELRAYTLIQKHNLTTLCGLTIPHLKSHDRQRHLIHIDFVSPPFLLDFAGVKFKNPGFTSDTMSDIHATIRHRFGNNDGIAYCVYHRLLKLGIYYLDLRPSNVNIEHHPDRVPDIPDEDEPY